MRILSFIILLTFAMVSMAAPIQTIRFATDANYPPFEYLTDTGQLMGFDIDIASALCQKIGARCEFANKPFNELSADLYTNKVDAVIAALSVTGERKEDVTFTNVYHVPSARFIGPVSKHLSINQLSGKRVGVEQGSTFEKYLHATYRSKVHILSYSSETDALNDLSAGRIDLVLADAPMLMNWLNQSNHRVYYRFIGKPIVNRHYFGKGYGIAVRKDNNTLLNALNSALAEIKRDGTYHKISAAYFNKV